jgi:hypothetical protein
MKETAFVSFVFQLRSFDDEIKKRIWALDSYLTKTFVGHEIIIVDNSGHPDLFGRLQAVFEQAHGLVSLIKLHRRDKHEVAMLAGADKSVGDYLFQMEELIFDFEFDLLWQMFKASQAGFDVVAATPLGEKTPYSSRLFYGVFNRLSDLDEAMSSERVLLVSRRALNSSLNSKQRLRYQKALLSRSGYHRHAIEYAPVAIAASPQRSLWERMNLASEIFINYSSIGSKIGMTLSILFIGFACVVVGYVLYSYFFLSNISKGWASIMLFLSISFSGLFFFLSIISEYARQILLEVQGNPFYIIEANTSNFSQRQNIQASSQVPRRIET